MPTGISRVKGTEAMNISLQQFAAMNMVYNRYSFSYFLDSMQRLNVSNFELWTGAPHLNCMFQTMADAASVRKSVRERGLHMVCLTPEQVMYPYNIAAVIPELRQKSLDYFHRYIDMTAELEIDKMLCCAGWGDYDEPDKETAWRRSVDALGEMTLHAEKAGVTLAFEILQPTESNLVHDFASTKRMMEEIVHPNFQLCVETVPVRREGKTLVDYFEAFGSRICHLHLTDGTPIGHVPCGMGNMDVAAQLRDMQRYHYEKYITLEIGDTSWAAEPEHATQFGFNTVKRFL